MSKYPGIFVLSSHSPCICNRTLWRSLTLSLHPHGCCLRSADISKSRNVIQLTSIWVRLDCFSLRMFVQTLEIIAAHCSSMSVRLVDPQKHQMGVIMTPPKKWLSSPKNWGSIRPAPFIQPNGRQLPNFLKGHYKCSTGKIKNALFMSKCYQWMLHH